MDDVFFDKDWPVIEDIKGNVFYISTEIILSEADVEGILVKVSFMQNNEINC